MPDGLIGALGGLGLILLGMTVMTGALRALADDRLRDALVRTVRSPWRGAVTGTVSTALLQSSSATTVAAVGFVGAGLLTFPQSLGVIFGANVGTTVTGWIVALVGLKLDLGRTLFPLILIGVLLRLTGRRRFESLGMTLAGFALVLLGIDVLQESMRGLQDHVTPASFPPDTIAGRLQLALLGLVVTLVTQSSSAGVAIALAAVHAGTMSLNQAAAMVIGMDVGTTATAALATIGGNVHARRTGFAHVVYNSLTGIGAFLVLTPYMWLVEWLLPGARTASPELVLVGFHTFFNTVGVIAALPVTDRFAALITRLVPGRGNPLIHRLNRELLSEPSSAIAAVRGTIADTTREVLVEIRRRLRDPTEEPDAELLERVNDAVSRSHEYLEELASRAEPRVGDHVACVHALDHLKRIERRLREDWRLQRCRSDESLSAMSDRLEEAAGLLAAATWPPSDDTCDRVRSIGRDLKTATRAYRIRVVEETSGDGTSASRALARMDTARSIRRIGQHLWRVAHHMSPVGGSGAQSSPPETSLVAE